MDKTAKQARQNGLDIKQARKNEQDKMGKTAKQARQNGKTSQLKREERVKQ